MTTPDPTSTPAPPGGQVIRPTRVTVYPPIEVGIPEATDQEIVQFVVLDTRTGEQVVAGRYEYGGRVFWRPGTDTAIVPLDGRLAFYEAGTQTWRTTTLPAPTSGIWSPDGTVFAYATFERDLHVLDVPNLRDTTLSDLGHPEAWSPDGSTLLGRRIGRLYPYQRSGAFAWVRLDAIGGPARVAGWLDDSTVLGDSGERDAVVVTFNVATRRRMQPRLEGVGGVDFATIDREHARVVVSHSGGMLSSYTLPGLALERHLGKLDFATFAPTGAIVAHRNRCLDDEELTTVDPATGAERRLTTLANGVSVSPDGTTLTFSLGNSLWRMPFDGSAAPVAVTDNQPMVFGAWWSGDSRYMAFPVNVLGHARCQ